MAQVQPPRGQLPSDGRTERPARLRVPLGPDTSRDVRAALLRRLAEHDAQRARAESVAADV